MSRSQMKIGIAEYQNGTEPITLDDGSERTYLEDGDTVILRGWRESADGPRIEFGSCTGTVLPAQ